jgi:hypothetical protein
MYTSYNLFMVLLYFYFPIIINFPVLVMMCGGESSFPLTCNHNMTSNQKLVISLFFAANILHTIYFINYTMHCSWRINLTNFEFKKEYT